MIKDQPAPVSNVNEAIWDLVVSDMKERDSIGRERYGTPLQGFNGRDALVDAYQEALDLVVYLRQAIWERDFGKGDYITTRPPSAPPPVREIKEGVEIVHQEVLTSHSPKPFIMTSEDVYV